MYFVFNIFYFFNNFSIFFNILLRNNFWQNNKFPIINSKIEKKTDIEIDNCYNY